MACYPTTNFSPWSTAVLSVSLLAALAAGLPPCSGVAVGFDRCVMVATGATHIDEIIAFPLEHA